MKINGFVVSLLATILVAYLFPQLGDYLPLKTITDIGIGFIFFFYGLKLSVSELKLGMSNYKLHILIQLTTFLLFPALVLIAYPFLKDTTAEEYWLAFFFLAALPSTVSSSVVMVSLAKGNIPAAIFNASLSGIIGVIITPFWLGFFLDASEGFTFTDVFLKLLYQIIIPLTLGFLLHRTLRVFVNRYKSKLGLFDKCIIVLIVYSSFSTSFTANIFSNLSFLSLLLLFACVLALFYIIYGATGLIANWLHFNKEDTITARFCGSKKSLVHGSVMAKIIFGNSAGAGLFLLPIMLFHITQLILVSIFAERYAKRGN
ncbi:solute carrier family 10 (sodium/bile acid cotransporter), member 7 [Mesonia phycicola]|uniref:Solute carrier family 10 (Sodium/bile acid cotransporter), member 7 n=1 Tax=Mesonia phycicola TaxID=579105 RepID=A0A1M6GM85_9FLAO|nr:bile acid:sodium symporter family protein [Mesonia phycicola]SHJ11048.1 solute carrier family 10 (sodium/bile acid cotransporter), member 7 [Mesonia phycicola]